MKRFVLLFLGSLFFIAAAVQASMPGAPEKTIQVTVQEGQTLWDIAAKHSDNTIDVREYIYEIQQMNHITHAGRLQPGQVLTIPVLEKREDNK